MTDIISVKKFEEALTFQSPIPISWAVNNYKFALGIINNLQGKMDEKDTTIKNQKDEINGLNDTLSISQDCTTHLNELVTELGVDNRAMRACLDYIPKLTEQELTKQKAIVDLVVKELQWYADIDNHVELGIGGTLASIDEGRKARTTLSEIARLQNAPIS